MRPALPSPSTSSMNRLGVERVFFGDEDESATHAFAICRAIRRRVFIEGQGIDPQLEYQGDEEAIHFLARLGADPAAPGCGTARLRFVDAVAKAERVAVLSDHRLRGCGRALMRALEQEARDRGHAELHLHAQVSAISFYERIGYVARGEVFLEEGIDHRVMTRALR